MLISSKIQKQTIIAYTQALGQKSFIYAGYDTALFKLAQHKKRWIIMHSSQCKQKSNYAFEHDSFCLWE